MAAFHEIRLPSLDLPLLARELTELANRRRTYWLRVLYAVLLFVAAWLSFRDVLEAGGGPFAVLGQGRRMFDALVMLQFAGIYLFMPLLGCSAITAEKERNTLGLLFLTKLGPVTIIFEKLLSRLVPMFAFLLLAMPLLAFTYSLGGVTELQLWGSIGLIGLTAVQVASLTLMCSAYCATTMAAFVSSYALSLGSLLFCSCCGVTISNGGMGFGPEELIVRGVMLGISTVVFLLLALSYLTERAFVVPNSVLYRSFNRYEKVSVASDGAGGGMLLVRRAQSLPDDDPVAWRETARSEIGLSNSSVRALLAIEVPLLSVLALMQLYAPNVDTFAFIQGIQTIHVIIAALLLVVTTSGAISRERARQTLESLLTTPMSGREMLSQKLRVVWRLMLVLWIPFGSIAFFGTFAWAVHEFRPREGIAILTSLIAALIYLPLVVWLSLLVSLLVKSQGRAILLTVGLICAWVFLPLLLPAPHQFADANYLLEVSWLVGSPATLMQHATSGTITWGIVVLVHVLSYGMILSAIRHYVLTRADRLLGRLGDRDDVSLFSLSRVR